jgi:SAM-dependent methyltransferase
MKISWVRAVVVGLGMMLGAGMVWAQAPAQQPRPTSTPYAGDLSIFEYPDRDQKLQPQKIMDLLHVKAGSTFADIGAGSGWFTVRAAKRVGPHGVVYAEDINPKAIAYIENRARQEKLGNIKEVLGTPDDAKLPEHSIDALLLLKVYHEIAHGPWVEPRCGRERDGGSGLQARGLVRLHEGRWAGLFLDLPGEVKQRQVRPGRVLGRSAWYG